MSATLYRSDYASDYQFRKEVEKHKQMGFTVHRVNGGVKIFARQSDFEKWKKQREGGK